MKRAVIHPGDTWADVLKCIYKPEKVAQAEPYGVYVKEIASALVRMFQKTTSPSSYVAESAFGAELKSKSTNVLDDRIWKILIHAATVELLRAQNLEPSQLAIASYAMGESLLPCVMATRWAEYGFPVLKLSSAQASALVLTEADSEILEKPEAPWRAFFITFSNPWISDIEGGAIKAIRVFRLKSDSAAEEEEMGVEDWFIEVFLERDRYRDISKSKSLYADFELLTLPDEDVFRRAIHEIQGGTPGGTDFSDAQKRVMNLAKRLVVNASIFITGQNREGLERVTSLHSKRSAMFRRALEKTQGPPVQEYVIGMPVSVDFTEVLHEYVSGESGDRLRKIRWVVRGHFRNQACGPKQSLRKQIYIEPHWKGSEDAPILVREHVGVGIPKSSN